MVVFEDVNFLNFGFFFGGGVPVGCFFGGKSLLRPNDDLLMVGCP